MYPLRVPKYSRQHYEKQFIQASFCLRVLCVDFGLAHTKRPHTALSFLELLEQICIVVGKVSV